MIIIIIVTMGQIGPGRVRSNCIRKSTGSENELMFTLDSVTLAGLSVYLLSLLTPPHFM